MAEEQESQQEQSASSETSYEGLQQNQATIDAMWHALQALGQDVAYGDNKKILDTFLTEKRYFDTNILSTMSVASDVEGMDDTYRKLLAHSMDAVDRLPNFGEGSAPKGAAITDYLLAGVFDPTNLASAVAAAFTFGAGGAAGLAAKEAAKSGVKLAIKSRIKNALSPAVLKSLAVEGTVAGAGGTYQEYEKQNVEKDIGLRKDIDPSSIALQGLLEGTISPIAGVATNMLASGITKAGKAGLKKTGLSDIDAVERASAWLERNLMPTAGTSEVTRRFVERNSGQVSSFKERAEKLTEQFNKTLSKGFDPVDIQGENSLINKALEGDAEALDLVANKNMDTRNLIDDFYALREESFSYGRDSSLNKKTKAIYDKDSNYVRSVVEAYTVNKRLQNFDDFLKENTDVLLNLKDEMRLAAETAAKNSDVKNRFKKFTDRYMVNGSVVNNDLENKLVKEAAKELYSPTRLMRKETGAFEQKVTLPPTVKKILGYNNIPALRIVETINGIVDTAARANTARDVGMDLISNKLAVRAANPAEAIAKLGTEEVMPLLTNVSKFKGKDEVLEGAMKVPFMRVSDDLKNIYVTKSEGLKVKELFEDNFFGQQLAEKNKILGVGLKTLLGTQAFAKAGKTVYSPIALMRNALGAAGYMISSGNTRGIVDGLTYAKKLSPKNQDAMIKKFQSLGLQGSNIDLNQTLKRFGDISDKVDDGNFLQKFVMTGGLSIFGKPGVAAAKVARGLYGGVDDAAKYGVWSNEVRQADKVFNSFSPDIQKKKLEDFSKQYGIINPSKQDYIEEQAAIKTANITPMYGRTAKILEKMRSFPIIGTFTAYPAERLRNTYNILKIGTDEMREGFETGNTALRNQGIKRLAQWYAAQGAFFTTAYAVNAATGNDDLVDKMRTGLPDWEKNAALLVTGKTADGKPKYINLSYMNPDQYVLEGIIPMMMKASRGEDVSKDLDKSILAAGKKLFEPYINPSLALEAASSLTNIVKGDFSDSNFLKLGKTVEPGYSKFVRDMAKDSDTFSKFGKAGSDLERFLYPQRFGTIDERAEDFTDMLAKNGLVFPGMREQVFDTKKVMGYTLNTINRNATQNFNSFANNLRDVLTDPRSRYDYGNILKEYNEVLQEQFTAQQAIRKLFKDMEGIEGRDKLINNIKSFGLESVTPSNKATISILNGRSNPITKSNDKKFWLNINKDLRDRTGLSYVEELSALRRNMANLERFYRGKDLRDDPPNMQIGEE